MTWCNNNHLKLNIYKIYLSEECGSRERKLRDQYVVVSALFFAVLCWGGNIKAGGAKRFKKLVRKANPVIMLKLDSPDSGREEDNGQNQSHLPLQCYLTNCGKWQLVQPLGHPT